MNELEESQVQRQALLRDPTVRAQPTPQQRPEAFEGVDVDLTEPVLVVVSGVLASRVTHRVMGVTPFGKAVVDVVFVGIDHAPLGDRLLDQRADRHLFDVRQHPDHDLAGPLEHPEDRRLLLLQCPPAALPLQTSSATGPAFFFTASG